MRNNALIGTAALALIALTVLVAMPAAGLSVMDTTASVSEQADQNASNTNETAANENASTPGEQLSGIVGVQEAELEGDLDKRTYGIKVAQAASQDAQADVVAKELNKIEQRLSDLNERKADLDEKRESGEISEGQYRAKVSKLAAQSKSVSDLANQSESIAGQFPAALLDEKGINVDAITTLKENAAALSGGEVAQIAKEIAGPNVGEIPSGTPPVELPAEAPAEADDGENESDDEGESDETPAGNSDENTGY